MSGSRSLSDDALAKRTKRRIRAGSGEQPDPQVHVEPVRHGELSPHTPGVPRLIEASHHASGIATLTRPLEEVDEFGDDGILVGTKMLDGQPWSPDTHGSDILPRGFSLPSDERDTVDTDP